MPDKSIERSHIGPRQVAPWAMGAQDVKDWRALSLIEVTQASFNGKTIQNYRRTHRIDLPTAQTGWVLRVRRLTPNANSSTIADSTMIDSITEAIDAKLRYPMSALLQLE